MALLEFGPPCGPLAETVQSKSLSIMRDQLDSTGRTPTYKWHKISEVRIPYSEEADNYVYLFNSFETHEVFLSLP